MATPSNKNAASAPRSDRSIAITFIRGDTHMPDKDSQLPATQHVVEPEAPLTIREDAVPVRGLAAERITDVLPAMAYERIGQMVISPEADAVLNEPLPDDEVDIRPDGLIYASHEYVVRQLNRAFGRMGWTLIPGSPLARRPDANPPEYFQRWVLFVGGVYCAEALASRVFYDNGQMHLDDVAEAIKSDCKSRVAKDLGIATECWNRRFAKKWRDEFAVQVVAPKRDKGQMINAKLWRRIDGDALEGELGTVEETEKKRRTQDSARATGSAVNQGGSPPPPTAPVAAPASSGKAPAETPGNGERQAGVALPIQPPRVEAPGPTDLKTMRGGLLPQQERAIWARARAAGLVDHEDANALIDLLVKGNYTTIVPISGRTSTENCAAMFKGIQGMKLAALLKQIDASKVTRPDQVETI